MNSDIIHLAQNRANSFFAEQPAKYTLHHKNVLLSLAALSASRCQDCPLHSTRTKVVYGDGDANSPLMVIGEGPGQTEDETGIPFVGKAGQLFDKILAAMKQSRRTIYITNIVKCRPPNNRNPQDEEVTSCRHFLDEQIEIIKPKIIMTLGSPAVKALLNTDQGIFKLRGNFYKYKEIPVLPTFHPSFLLRDPSHKGKCWEDVQKVMKFLAEN